MEGTPELVRESDKLNMLIEMRSEAYAKDRKGTHEKIFVRGEELKRKYGNDCYNYTAFHVLIGSSTRDLPNFDFPGEDSVEEFLRSL